MHATKTNLGFQMAHALHVAELVFTRILLTEAVYLAMQRVQWDVMVQLLLTVVVALMAKES